MADLPFWFLDSLAPSIACRRCGDPTPERYTTLSWLTAAPEEGKSLPLQSIDLCPTCAAAVARLIGLE